MQQRSTRLRTILVALVLAIAILLIAGLVLHRTNTSGKVAVKVYVLPQDARLTINGKQYSQGTAYLAAGNYTVTASKAGYKSTSRTYSVDPSIKDPILNVILAPDSAGAQTYYNQNQKLYNEREGIGSQQAHQQSSLIIQKNPITQQLPYENLVYTIGYRSDPSDPTGHSIIIVIDAPIGNRNAAVNQIRQLGYDPADYRISFENYTNPFTP